MRVAVAGGTGLSGREVVRAARRRGDEVVVLSRTTGVDLTSADGLAERLAGVEVVIDVTGPVTTERAAATDFFEVVARNLQAAGSAAGVQRIVGLSIVGIDDLAGHEYYDAKLAHEAAWRKGPLPVTILRAAQFHDFGRQLMAWSRDGDEVLVPEQPVRTVAVSTVGEHLARLAHEPGEGTLDLVGPHKDVLLRQVDAFIALSGERLRTRSVHREGRAWDLIRAGALQGGPDAIVDGPGFDEWLAGQGQ